MYDISGLNLNISTKYTTYYNLKTDDQKISSDLKYIKPINLPGDCCTGLSITSPESIKQIVVKLGTETIHTFQEFDLNVIPFSIYKKDFNMLEFIIHLKNTSVPLPVLKIETGLLRLRDINMIELKNISFTEISKPKELKRKFFSFFSLKK